MWLHFATSLSLVERVGRKINIVRRAMQGSVEPYPYPSMQYPAPDLITPSTAA
jgi:hypothetical protein